MIPGKQYRPEDFLRIAWRRKWLIALPLVAVIVPTVVYTRFLPNIYKSTSLILVVPQRVPESYVQSTITMRIEDRLQSISQQILSRPRLERIIQDFNLYPERRQKDVMEDIVQRMRNTEIEVQVVKGDAFRVSYISTEPRTAMRVVERLASLFIEENLRDREVLAEGTNQFLESQLDDARRRLVEHEKRLAEYRLKHADQMPGHLEANLQAQHNAEMQIQAIGNALSIDFDRRRNLERQLADLTAVPATDAQTSPGSGSDGSPQGVASGSRSTAAEQLATARANAAAMELRLKPEHPDVIRTRRLIVELEKQAEEEAASAPVASSHRPPVTAVERARQSRLAGLRLDIENLSREIATKEDQERKLRATVVTFQERLAALPLRETELAELSRDYDTIRQLYQGLLGKYESSKISANLERRQQSEQFRVLEPARLPERPFSPDRARMNLMGAVFGLAFGLGLVVLLEYFDTSMRSEQDVLIALALPVLALVPHIEDAAERRLRRRRRIVWGLTATATMVVAAAGAAWFLKAI